MLDPKIVKSLQTLLAEFPSWEIFVAIFVRGPDGERWPDMGLIIRKHEIVDGLRREYVPLEYRSIQYEGSRPGTDRD